MPVFFGPGFFALVQLAKARDVRAYAHPLVKDGTIELLRLRARKIIMDKALDGALMLYALAHPELPGALTGD
jgi:hypothetical protein